MRRYETIFILRPTLSEEEITDRIDSTKAIIEDIGGSTIQLDKWGTRKLAYLIKKEKQGYYVFCDYATEPNAVAEIERKFRIDDGVLKYLTVKLSDDIDSDAIAEAKGELEAQQKAEEEEKAAAEAEKAAASAQKESTEKPSDKDETAAVEPKETTVVEPTETAVVEPTETAADQGDKSKE